MRRLLLLLLAAFALPSALSAADSPSALRLATFTVDATPPFGSMMAYGNVIRQYVVPLQCCGVVLLDAGEPIVLCAFDWIGIANEGNDVFRQGLAAAAGTSPNRVAVHTLHQHDAP